MAGGKLSARQKMINLMYLVFIAMLAMNMSKEVLSAFGLMNERLVEANRSADDRNLSFMANLDAKVEEQPEKFGPLRDKARQVASLSNELDAYLGEVKKGLENSVKQADLEKGSYESMDKTDYFDILFFKGENYTDDGNEFLDKINSYREGVKSILGDEKGEAYQKIMADLDQKFNTDDVTRRDGAKVAWLNYHYQGFPMIASRTKLSQLQNDVKSTSSEILSTMLEGQLTSEVSMTNYQAIVVPEKTAFFSGENFKGRVVLGRFDNTMSYDKVLVNGNEVSSFEGGQVVLDFPAGNVGQQELKGELQFKEGDSIVSIPIESTYAVIPKPNAAVISADKMNVVYRGVKNPMTISIPGVGQATANAPGLSAAGGAGKYVMDATGIRAREVNINVSGKLPDGETVSDSKTFRIKEIPRPVASIRGEDGSMRMQRNALSASTVQALIPDFDFDVKLNVSEFKFKVPGQPTTIVRGARLDSKAQDALKRARRGEAVQIFDVVATLQGAPGYKLPKVSPLFIELTN